MLTLVVAFGMGPISAYGTLVTSASCGAGENSSGSEWQHMIGTSYTRCEASAIWSYAGHLVKEGVITEAIADYGHLLVDGVGGGAHQSWQLLGEDDGSAPPYYGITTKLQGGSASFEDSLTIVNAPHNATLLAWVSGTRYESLAESNQESHIVIGGVSKLVLHDLVEEFHEIPFSRGVPIPVKAWIQSYGSNGYGNHYSVFRRLELRFMLLSDYDGSFDWPSDYQSLINAFSYQTRSGATYSLGGTIVPEPGSAWLSVIAAVGLLIRVAHSSRPM